jgi:citrate synthase
MILKEKLASQLPEWRERVKKLIKESGDVKVGDVTISQVYGGMRDVKGLVTDISYVDPNEGIRLRGYTISELLEKLPKAQGAKIPLVGGLYYLLLIGEIPSLEEAKEIENEWKARWEIPPYVFDVLKSMPSDTHPMTLLSMGILAMQRESIFTRQYHQGMRKDDYWEPMLEDSLNLTARLPALAAFIYNLKYKDGSLLSPDSNLEGAANFARMMGIPQNEFIELTRLYLIIHSDHESGNASAHATHLVASTLSDIYYATSAAIDALAGPLHGLANQESLAWLLKVYNKFGHVPGNEELAQFAVDTLNSGQVIPGYGHAVLRKTDPRFSALMEFGKQYFPDDAIFSLATRVYEVIPGVLRQQGKAKDPWPNVDAISGSVLYHFGIKEFDFYTVMFGISRALGVSANTVWARALGQPIERPKSLTTTMLEQIAEKQTA